MKINTYKTKKDNSVLFLYFCLTIIFIFMKFKGLYRAGHIVNQYQNLCRGICVVDDLDVDVFLCDNTIHIIVPCPKLTRSDNIVALFVCDNNKNYVTVKNYEVEIQEPLVKDIEQTVMEFNHISLSVACQTGGILHPTTYDELKMYVDNYSADVELNSFIWNPHKDFNIYNEPYKDGYGVYLGKCLRYCVKDKEIADKICEILKKDLTNFVLGRYPIKQRTHE